MTERDGTTLNGKPILAIEDVQCWLPMSDEGAARVARYLNELALIVSRWAPHFAEDRKSNPSAERILRIRGALDVLNNDLPDVLRDQTTVLGSNLPEPARSSAIKIEQLRAIVTELTPSFTNVPTPGRGRPVELSGNVVIKIGEMIDQIYEEENSGDRLQKKARDGFVTNAMTWLGVPGTDAAHAKRRSRKRAGQ